MIEALARGDAFQINLDDFRWAGPDQEQKLDVRTALEKPVDHTVDLVVDVGKSRKIPFGQNGGAEAWFGEDHHSGCGLKQMRAGARSNNQEEGVLNLSVSQTMPVRPQKTSRWPRSRKMGVVAQAAGGARRASSLVRAVTTLSPAQPTQRTRRSGRRGERP